MDRQWQSDRGGLYFTIVRRPPVRPTEGFKYTFIAAFVLADLLRTICNIDAGLKWPNDILVDKKKLSGMLSAMQASQNRIDFLNIGIGLNVNNTLSHAAPDAIALQEIAGTPFSRQDVLTRFLDRLQDNSYDTMPPAEAINRWKQYAIGIHHTPVRVVTLRETVQGIAEDVDNTGALVVRLHDGTRRRISVGDCFI